MPVSKKMRTLLANFFHSCDCNKIYSYGTLDMNISSFYVVLFTCAEMHAQREGEASFNTRMHYPGNAKINKVPAVV